MKSWIAILGVGLLAFACAMGQKMVNLEAFYEVPIGMTTEELVDRLGSPYSIVSKEEGIEEYEYIERIDIGARVVDERHYIFVIENDHVTSKRLKEQQLPPYRFNSYEMQTTQGSQGS